MSGRIKNAFLSDNYACGSGVWNEETKSYSSKGDGWSGFTHVLLSEDPDRCVELVGDELREWIPTVEGTCGVYHVGGSVDYLDCPVASRWTLMRSPT